MLSWAESTIPVDSPASVLAFGCSASTAPCWLLGPGLAWRRTDAGRQQQRDSKLTLVAAVEGRQRHSAQLQCCFS